MSYSEFLDLVGNGIKLFLDSLISFSNSFINNYFFITLLGLSIFTFLLYFFLDYFVLAPSKVCDNVDKWIDSKRNLVMSNDVQVNFLDTHFVDVSLLKIKHLAINKLIFSNYLSSDFGKFVEFSLLKSNNSSNQSKSNVSQSVPDVPIWFDKDISKQPLSDSEKKELDDILTI